MSDIENEKKTGRKLYTGILSRYAEMWRISEIKKYVQGDAILDLGCGYGKLSTYFIKETYFGVDVNPHALGKAKEKYGSLNSTQFLTLEEFNQTSELFDTIILAAVIEHLHDPISLLLSMKKRLKTEGIIILTTPSHIANNIHKYGAKINLFSQGAADEHVKIYSEKDLSILSQSIGMDMVLYRKFVFGLNQIVIFKKMTR
ncbi:MAG: class I SAM-dependent methyltransferase [Candidatus Methanofastidiosa archaeon]|nr:class I SAM-dependent methyltransferase [Candidatus Methanofastidiosa archaeon]